MPLGTKCVDAAVCVPADSETRVHSAVILTHGAGGDMHFPPLVSLARALASSGVISLRFTCRALNLSYRVKVFHAVWVRLSVPQHLFASSPCGSVWICMNNMLVSSHRNI